MFFDTSSVDSALQSLLAFRYPDADTSPVLITPNPRDRVKRTEELAALLRDYERTIVAVAHLEVKIWALGRQLRSRASTIANAFTPVSALPTEILQDIFRMAVVDDDTPRARIVLSHVCSRWRSVSLAVPELWTEVQHRLSYRNDMAAEFLARSGSLGLRISLDTSIPSSNIPSSRLSSVTLCGRLTEEAFRAVIPPSPVPNLEHMSLRQDYTLGNLPVCWQMTNLRVLQLYGVSLSYEGVGLPHLEEVEISNMSFSSLYQTVFRLSAQALSRIELSHITTATSPDTDASLARKLLLKRAKHLIIKDCDPLVIENIFVHTLMPRLQHLTLSMGSIMHREGMDALSGLPGFVCFDAV